MSKKFGCLLVLLLGFTLLQPVSPASTHVAEGAFPARASTPKVKVSVSGNGVSTYPRFRRGVHRYGIRTTEQTRGTVQVTVRSKDDLPGLQVNGAPAQPGQPVTVRNLEEGDEVAVLIAGTDLAWSFIYLPSGFPTMRVTAPGVPSDGYVFLTPANFFGDSFATVVDNNGVPIMVRSLAGGGDFKQQPNGNYSVARPTEVEGRSGEQIVELDGTFDQVGVHDAVGLTNTDFHDSILDPDGTRTTVSYEGGGGQIDAVIQETAADGTVLFEWNSRDHFAVDDAFVHPVGDYAHINSVQEMADGDLIASFRNLNTVAKIARTAHDGHTQGDVIWRLGGKHSDFTFANDPWGGPCAQHTAYELGNGNILLFDNGAAEAVPPDDFGAPQTADMCPGPDAAPGEPVARPTSRAVEYSLDEETMVATKVWEYRLPGARHSRFAGSTQRLSNGNTFIGWAIVVPLDPGGPTASEVNADGNLVWQLRMQKGYTSYRAFRFDAPDLTPPTVRIPAKVRDGRFRQGRRVPARVRCSDRGGSSLTDCGIRGLRKQKLRTSTRGKHTLTVTARDGSGHTTRRHETYRVIRAVKRPDAMFRLPGARWRGNDVFSALGRTRMTLRTRTGRTRVVQLRFQNDGVRATRMRVLGPGTTRGWRVRYFHAGKNVTKAVTDGRYRTRKLDTGASARLRMKVTRRRGASPRSLRVRVTNVRGSNTWDNVIARFR